MIAEIVNIMNITEPSLYQQGYKAGQNGQPPIYVTEDDYMMGYDAALHEKWGHLTGSKQPA